MRSYWTGLPRRLSSKESLCRYRRRRFDPWVGKISLRRKWKPTPGFLLRKFHGQRSLAGYSPWGHKGSDMTEWLSRHACTHWIRGEPKSKDWSPYEKKGLWRARTTQLKSQTQARGQRSAWGQLSKPRAARDRQDSKAGSQSRQGRALT